MKSQISKLVIIALVAVMSVAVFSSAAAKEQSRSIMCMPSRLMRPAACDPCGPSSITAQVGCPTPPADPCDPTSMVAQTSCPTPPPYDPCAPTSITAMGDARSCVTPEPPVVSTPDPVVNYDENVSFNDTDLGVTLLKSKDEQGNVQMDVFHTNTGTTVTTYLFSITQEDIAPFIAEHPAENTLLASASGVSVYMLTTGEIQVNAGPDAEGKYHVKIFNGIPWTHVYGYTIDPVK